MKKYLYNFLLLIILLLVCFIGAVQPRMVDDYGYLQLTRSMPFFELLKGMYMNWSGRILNLFIMKFSFYNDFFYYFSGILNGAAFIATIFLITTCALGRFPKIFSYDRIIFIIAFATAWFGMPALGECVFWRSGGGSYLWPMLFGLITLTPYILWYKSKEPASSNSILYCILIIPVGLFAGASHEQVAISVGFLLGIWFIYIIWFNRESKKIPYYLYAGFASFLTGALILFFAPGNYKRLGTINMDTIQISIFGKLAKQVGDFIIYVIGYGALYLWIWLMVILLIAYILNHKDIRDRVNDFILWFITAFVSILLVIFLPLGGQRPMYFFIIFITLSFISLLNVKIENIKAFYNEKISGIITAVLISIITIDCVLGLFSNYLLSKQMYDREKIITAAKEKGIEKIIVPPISIRESHITFVSDNPNDVFMEKSVEVDYSAETKRYKPKNIIDELKVYLRDIVRK